MLRVSGSATPSRSSRTGSGHGSVSAALPSVRANRTTTGAEYQPPRAGALEVTSAVIAGLVRRVGPADGV